VAADRWSDLSRRLRSIAYHECTGHGAAQIAVTLYLDRGELHYWSEPQVTYYEPRGQGKQILRRLGATLDVDDGEEDGEGIEPLREG